MPHVDIKCFAGRTDEQKMECANQIADTEEYMKEKDLMYLEYMADFYSAEDINSVKEGICSLTKWIPAEWDILMMKEFLLLKHIQRVF